MFVCGLGATTIYSLAFAPNGSLVAGTKNGRVTAVTPFGEARTLFEMNPPRKADIAVNAVRVHHNGLIAIASDDGWRILHGDSSHGGWKSPKSFCCTSIVFLDEKTIAIGTGDRIRETAGGFELCTFELGLRREPHFAEPKGVRAVATRKGTVTWATGHQKLIVWNPLNQDPISIPLKHTACSIAFHPDGASIAVAQEWGAKLIDIAKKYEVRNFTGHKGRVTSVAFRPDGRVLATGSWDGSVRLWDVITGELISSLSAAIGRVFTIAYDAEGQRLAAGGDAGNIAIWDVE